ncbi:hypothetical protein [Dactylosporangium darangshiense]|uniref:Uncharacterized protein n=1 Tax=Dactylosporangium darangshiense TaxID=579108 RepID=A0ABP8DTJ2_9ACTN
MRLGQDLVQNLVDVQTRLTTEPLRQVDLQPVPQDLHHRLGPPKAGLPTSAAGSHQPGDATAVATALDPDPQALLTGPPSADNLDRHLARQNFQLELVPVREGLLALTEVHLVDAVLGEVRSGLAVVVELEIIEVLRGQADGRPMFDNAGGFVLFDRHHRPGHAVVGGTDSVQSIPQWVGTGRPARCSRLAPAR